MERGLKRDAAGLKPVSEVAPFRVITGGRWGSDWREILGAGSLNIVQPVLPITNGRVVISGTARSRKGEDHCCL